MRHDDVSVVMTNYNYARFLPRAINAVLGQSIRPREFIAIDDASTDDSMQVLEQHARQDSLIQVVRLERNVGVVAALNRGRQLATGTYVMFLAADDYLLPGMIERSLAILQQYPHSGLSCAYHSVVKETTGEIVANPSRWCKQARFFAPHELAHVIGPGCIAGHTAIWRKDALDRAGGFDPELRWHCDWFVNLVIAFRHGLCHVPDTLALLSQRENTYSASGMNDPVEQQAVLTAILRRLLSPENADVLPLFQCSGVMTPFSSNLVRAAARLPQRWTPAVLGLIDGMDVETYEALLDDDHSEVRALSQFLLGPMWWRRKNYLDARVARMIRRFTALASTPAGRRLRSLLNRTGNALFRLGKPFQRARSRRDAVG